jgi:SAM-dependent methyltransferase
VDLPWYRKAFGSLYPSIYAHRDEAEAEKAIDLLERSFPLNDSRVLDVACGGGRHLKALRERGARAFGLDLSEELLGEARTVGPVARADMRAVPFRPERFDGAVSMFTSFGYFEKDEENRRVLGEIASVLRPGGWLFLDYMNADWVVENLVPEGERSAGEFTVREKRKYDSSNKILVKSVYILGRNGKLVDSWEERLLLYFPGDLKRALAGAGLKLLREYGDYEGGGVRRDANRFIAVCAREGRRETERSGTE